MLKVIGWIDYDDFQFESAEGTDEELKAVADNIKEHGYKFGGDDHENYPCCCPVLSNGKALRLSWRNWGYVMALAYDLKTEDGNYNHILWYMGEYGPSERVFPKREELDYGAITGYKVLVYEVADEELYSVNNAFISRLVFPIEFFNKNELHVSDKIIVKHNGAVLFNAVVGPDKFIRTTVKELYVKDDYFFLADYSNFKFLDEIKVKNLLKEKYNISSEDLIIVDIKITEDNRKDYNYDD